MADSKAEITEYVYACETSDIPLVAGGSIGFLKCWLSIDMLLRESILMDPEYQRPQFERCRCVLEK